MKVIRIGSQPVHKAPMPSGPQVEVLIGDGAQLAVAHAQIPLGGGMPEHAHGDSETIAVVRQGRVEMTSGGHTVTLEPGAIALLAVGERVSLHNPGDAPASLLVYFAPPDFIRTFAGWPVREGTA